MRPLRRSNITLLLGTLGVFAVSCGQPKPSLTPAGASDAGHDAGPALIIDAGPQPLPEPTLTATWDGGQADLLAPDASVSPMSEFRFETAVTLADCRIRILDDDERMLPNHAAFERGNGGTTVDLTVTKALPSKHCCRFVVDGDLGSLMASSDHRLYQPLQARFSVWPQPAGAGSSRHKSHRRNRHRRHH